MDYDDIVYLKFLVFCLIFGYFYKRISDKEVKKWTGTMLGLTIIFMLSGYHSFHPLFVSLTNGIIILFIDKRKCHLTSFVFSFLYLLFFRTTAYFGIPYPPAHTNIIQMILTLKMVGLALEVKNEFLSKQECIDKESAPTKFEMEKNISPSFMDIFHYSFNYIGIITGPYFRYRTYRDYINLPFAKYADCEKHALQKMKVFPFVAISFLITSSIWPTSYATTDDFLHQRSWLYRFSYIWINFFIFRMRMYSAFILSECICIMAGFGAYPEITKPRPGHGPIDNFEEIDKIVNDPSRLQNERYSFETVHNIDIYKSDFSTTGREAMRHWNICVQYWLAVNVYKCFPYKKFRTIATMFVSAYWHGIYMGHYICIWTVALYVPVEDLYVNVFLKNSSNFSRKFWEWFVWYMKMQFFGYLSIAMQLLTFERVMNYYNSINHCCLIGLIILYVVGMIAKLTIYKENEKKNETNDLSNNCEIKKVN